MSRKNPRNAEDVLNDIDNSWEKEIERLKQEIRRAEERITKSEQSQLAESVKLLRGCDIKGNAMDPAYVSSSPSVERVIRGRKPTARSDVKSGGIWTSPKAPRTKRDILQDPFGGRLESSFELDCGSSVISLDFGLVSPRKSWCSPPQRIERAQNREWSSPHRVIDRPNPENSPGNWISMKESRHSPALDDQKQSPLFACPEPQSRPVSQSTYVVQTSLPAKDDQPTSKVSILENYEPERIVSTKKRTGERNNEALERNLQPTDEKIRKVVTPCGQIVKISLLDDFEAPVFGRSHEKTAETEEPAGKTKKGATKSSTRLAPSLTKTRAKKKKKEEAKKEDGISTGDHPVDGEDLNKNEEEEETKGKENKRTDSEKSTLKVIQNLEDILRSTKEDADKPSTAVSNKPNAEKPKPKKLKPDVEPTAEKPEEKRKRIVDAKAVREYIKNQKQKRMEQVKMEKKTKDAEREARKKKLEELRIKTLKLASHSKKKKPCHSPVKAAGTEDDVTMSLGLKQVTPRVSYNESVSKLRKKTPQVKSQLPSETEENVPEVSDVEEDEGDKTLEEVEVIEQEMTRTEEIIPARIEDSPKSDLNLTLKKLAETLHLKLDQREKEIRSRPVTVSSKPELNSQETWTVKSSPEETRQLITVDMETIKTLKSDIKKISENFKVLHEIIAEKGELSRRKARVPEKSREVPDWPKGWMPKAYPYNVYSAFQKKMNLGKVEGEFEGLSVPSDRLPSAKEIVGSFRSTSCGTYEENYFSMKDDSGSELSSSILDSEKQSVASKRPSNSSSRNIGRKDSLSSSIVTEITSRSLQSRNFVRTVDSDKEDLVLVTPDIKLVPSEPQQQKSLQQIAPGEMSASGRSGKDKTDSTIGELIADLSDGSAKGNKSVQEEVSGRRSFFQPEMLHLQFQAELTLLETFQQSLSQFLEAERKKTLSEVNRIVSEKAINTEKVPDVEDRSVQASYAKEESGKETESVQTEISVPESVKSNRPESPKAVSVSEITEKIASSSEKLKSLENSDAGSDHPEDSSNLLKDTTEEEEMRSEHLMALIRLREKTLNEKVKAELTFLEMKKRTLKERGGDEEQNISAIKKKQRGILLRYQSEKEDIERLKRTHKVEEKKTVVKRQRQFQFSDDLIIRLKKRGEKMPQKKAPLKPILHTQEEIPEDIPVQSDSLLSESLYSADESRHSSRSEVEVSPRSNFSKEDEAMKNKIFAKLESYKSKKSQLEVERYPRRQHSVEELLTWTKRLEEKENHLRELEKKAVKIRSRLAKTKSTKDRSTSPFQVQESTKTPSESPPEATETKKSSTISEAIDANTKTEETEKTESVAEKLQSSVTEDIPEQLSKKVLTSTEYQSESFESPSSSETAKNKPETGRKWELGHRGIAIKMSLSPRMSQSPRRRYSSGSDESVNLSHTETASEHSDLETRIAALHEELRKRKLEAERLRREQKKAQRERLRVKEQCLLNQIQAYDAYIQKKKQELEKEYEYSNQTIMKPLIKQPKVAEKPRGTSPIAEKLVRQIVEKEEKTPEKESDSEVVEQIKTESVREATEDSDSIKEQIESKVMEKSTENVEQSVTSASESLQEEAPGEGSQSESEEQSVSVKTTLQSPERQDTDAIRTAEMTQNRQTTDEEDSYRLDSFESDLEEKETSEVVEEVEEDVEEKSGKAEQIADSIIMGLILESVNRFCSKKAEVEKKLAEESRLGLELLSEYLSREIVSDAVECVIGIYNRKAEKSAAGVEQVLQEDQKPAEEEPTATNAEDEDTFLQSQIFTRKDKLEDQVIADERNGQEPQPETLGQEWIDDDLGLIQTRKEAEELRLQQLQIEQEIQQLQAQQKQVPYFYLREIPNKPPPPYTPPAKHLTEIPASEAEITRITTDAVRILTDQMSKGRTVADIEPDAEYYGDAASDNYKCYKLFLFDLAKHVVCELLDQQERKEEVLPWMRTRKRLSGYRYQKVERTFGSLNEFVQRQVFVLFGFGRKVSKESLIVRWIKKKRDHVDEILVGESQEEESQWTQYDEDQVAVKNEVALGILDGLLEDTAQVLGAIFENKMKKDRRRRSALSL